MSESSVILLGMMVLFLCVLPLVFGKSTSRVEKQKKDRPSYKQHVQAEMAALKQSERAWRGLE